jgi:uncharacterized protein with NAD-binding domain and iron-sulfur cluster
MHPMVKKVCVLGGGVAGLSVAHELCGEFEVHIFEEAPEVGGKARSQTLLGTGTGGRADLPGEHGFRFFPAFYRNVIDTMSRIPVPGGNVAMRLIPCEEFAVAEPEHAPVNIPQNTQDGVGGFFRVVEAVESLYLAFQPREEDLARISAKMLLFMVSCDQRRVGEYERISFWDFIEGDRYEPRFQRLLNSPRFMVAMQSRRGSARTIGRMAIQLLLDFRRSTRARDRVLNGTTTTQWIQPWREHLEERGVHFHQGTVERFEVDVPARRVRAAIISGERVQADYYVAALPIDRVISTISDDMAKVDESLSRLRSAPVGDGSTSLTRWMSGAQFYLKKKLDFCRGHVAFPAAPWALSSISQAQFWSFDPVRGENLPPIEARFGNGEVRDILSVDISDWFTPNARGKCAKDCTSEDEVLDECWAELKAALNGGGQNLLSDSDLVTRRLDRNLRFTPSGAVNATPLLVHPPGSLSFRPRHFTSLGNLMLAADYVQTSTDLATMEGANEAARMAANAVFDCEGKPARATVFHLVEDTGVLAAVAKEWDASRWYASSPPRLKELSSRVGLTMGQVRAAQNERIVKLGLGG